MLRGKSYPIHTAQFKKIGVGMMICVVMFQSFNKLFILSAFHLNRDYVTRVFCENKSRPKMHCNGSCHLKKALKEEQKKNQGPFQKGSFENGERVYISPETIAPVTSLEESGIPPSIEKTVPLTGFSASIFHPPRA